MTTYTDDFNRAELGSDWIKVGNSHWSIESNEIKAAGSSDPDGAVPIIVYSTPMTSLAQAAEIVFSAASGTTVWMAPNVRSNSASRETYAFNFFESFSISNIAKIVGSTTTNLLSTSNGEAQDNQLLRLEISSANVLKSYVNGQLDGEYEDIDAPLENYYTGLSSAPQEFLWARGDDFLAEDMEPASAGPTTPTNLTTTDITADSFRAGWTP